MIGRLRRWFFDERGQSTAEYAVLFGVTFVVAAAMYILVDAYLLSYYQDVVSLICLPVP